jgi:hypothetical protein
MDRGSGPHAKHANENVPANIGIFRPGDVINYFFAAKNASGVWSYFSKSNKGQGRWFKSTLSNCRESPLECSVLPDAGRKPGLPGDKLLVNDSHGSDDGATATAWEWIFKYLELDVDRFDVLAASSAAGNSLASRVKNVHTQLIGDPIEIYKVILWDSGSLSSGLMGDGGSPNGGSGIEKSDDFSLCYTFLNSHPDHPGWAYFGDDVVQDWDRLTGYGALSVRDVFMNFVLNTSDQRTQTGVVSPIVYPTAPLASAPWFRPSQAFYAYGGCEVINDFDSPGATGASKVAYRYNNASSGPPAALTQWTVNAAGDTGFVAVVGWGWKIVRWIVEGYGGIRAAQELLEWLGNPTPYITGIEALAFENRLGNNYPNPFNPTTTIKYSIAERGHVQLKIYNAAGQLIRTLVNEEQAPQEVPFAKVWNGLNDQNQPVASGVYFYQLTAKNFSQTKKMVVLK